jgi:hypothetical protein
MPLSTTLATRDDRLELGRIHTGDCKATSRVTVPGLSASTGPAPLRHRVDALNLAGEWLFLCAQRRGKTELRHNVGRLSDIVRREQLAPG